MGTTVIDTGILNSSEAPPTDYDRAPTHAGMIREVDVYVPMRDGVKICVDIYRPDTTEKLPALLAFAIYNKDFQGPDVNQALPAQPAWTPLWTGPLEAGDTHFLVSRGYIHVIGSPRGVGKSEGGGSRQWDSYDLIEWIAGQPWCDGKIGMVGISGFGAEQFHVAKQQPPSLKAIFPFDPRGAYGTLGSFREEYPGGVLHLFRYLVGHFSAMHQHRGAPGSLPEPRETFWKEAMANPDYRMYPNILNMIAQKGQHMPPIFDMFIDPYEKPGTTEQAEADLKKIKIPSYTGSGWYGYTYKTHLNGAQNYFATIDAPKKLMLTGPAHVERPFHSFHREMLKWFDHWLRGVETDVMREPSVKFWVMGENRWRTATNWPLSETQWTKLYLNSWERLSAEPFTEGSVDQFVPPDAFVQMPPTQTKAIQKLRYMTDPLPDDVLVAGPISLTLFGEIDQDDTNWIVILKDVGPDVSVMSVREGERDLPANLPEREVTRGWLKASLRQTDPKRSKPWKPWHLLTRDSRKPVVPGEVNEYQIEVMATANMFRKGHRICVEIASMDLPTGVAGATNAEYVPYHICSSKTVMHKIYHAAERPSHLLLPVIPT
ncbi:CocE/NonD family hydrolase [Leptospira sp. severe_002]|uniref:CocE/NonD family hydrolase n=1 Tax=Leptospira sp. severe_002 TaxID=2838237 RepID=UPI001E5BD4CF|nr:CocE/NonD family hydrolase [Leptospira sp. severe_002]